MRSSDVIFHCCGEIELQPLDIIELEVKLDNMERNLNCYVLPEAGPTLVLVGR